MKNLYIFLYLLLPSLSFTQVSQEWVARYNSPANLSDGGISIAISGDGSIYTAGITTVTSTDLDYVLIKYDMSGNEIWVRTYDGPGNSFDQAISVTTDNSGNVIITGTSRSTPNEGSEDIATLKYNSNGDLIWTARYNGPDNLTDVPVKIKTDAAGNIYIAGNSRSIATANDVIALKYNTDGILQWQTRFNNPNNTDDNAFLMVMDDDLNMYITGWCFLNSFTDYLNIKINASGNILWYRTYNGPTDYEDKSHSVVVDSDGFIYSAGCSQDTGKSGIYDYATIKYSPDGDEIWVRRYNGIENGYDIANTVTIDNDNFIYVAGASEGHETGRDIALIKYDSSGNQIWINRYNSTFNGDEEAYVLITDNSDGIYIIGYSYSDPLNVDYITLKYNSSGELLWKQRYDGPAGGYDNAVSIALYNNDVFVTGLSSGISSGFDIATIKYSQSTSIHQISNEIPDEFELHQNYPNPFNPVTVINYSIKVSSTVSLKIFDVLGREVATLVSEVQSPGIYEVQFNGAGFSSGVYLYRLETGNYQETKRMTLIK